jgi:hypothetical protein
LDPGLTPAIITNSEAWNVNGFRLFFFAKNPILVLPGRDDYTG